jgi:toxin secretion/phage lysis holin
MMNFETIYKALFAGTGAIFGYIFGEWSVMLQVLTAFVILDYVTGVLAGAIEGKLSSKAGFKGIAKKVAIFLYVAVAHFVDMVIGGHMVQDAVIFFYIGNELISLIENGGRMGLPVPSQLQRAVDIFKGKADGK